MPGEQAAPLIVPRDAHWGPQFDVARATDAYFEGGYWIELWSASITVLIGWLLLRSRF